MRRISFFLLTVSCLVLVVAEGPPLPSPYGRGAIRPKNASPIKSLSSDHSRIVNQRLLDRVANILSQDAGQTEQQENEGFQIVDSDFLQRIARIISQNEGQTSPQAPVPQGPAITTDYGVPSEVGEKLVGAREIDLGQPQPARRIASFDFSIDLSEETDGGYTSSSSSGYAGNNRIMFITSPQMADTIATFRIPEEQVPKVNEGY